MLNNEEGKIGWILLWALGIPIPILVVQRIFSDCAKKIRKYRKSANEDKFMRSDLRGIIYKVNQTKGVCYERNE